MNQNQKQKQKEEQRAKLKQLRKELEEKIQGVIPEALKAEAATEEADTVIEESTEPDEATSKRIVEAVIFASSKPVTLRDLGRVLSHLSLTDIRNMVKELAAEYEANGRTFRLREIAGGYEYSTLPQYASWIGKLEREKKTKQASLAALETLAILAYRQPITRVEIEEIRGVSASGVISTLLERGFIKIVGRKEVPGRPLMYGTTPEFLEHFGLKAISELPDIEEIKTLVEDTIKREEILRKENIVENAAADEDVPSAPSEEDQENLAAFYDEIAGEIDEVKVMSQKQVHDMLNPPEEEETAEAEISEGSGDEISPESSNEENINVNDEDNNQVEETDESADADSDDDDQNRE